MRIVLSLLVFICLTWKALAVDTTNKSTFSDGLKAYLQERIGEFDQIDEERRAQLNQVAQYVKARIAAGQPVKLTFICTHNSRRSHLSQIWAAAAARYHRIDGVETFSGGTEATAFNPRAIAALERAGVLISKTEPGTNPRYAIRFVEADAPLICFSKVYSDPPNPGKDFCAVMTCSQADKGCPIVKGCALRVSLPFDDPKIADGTAAEARTYDERCAQICREMLFLFSLAAQ